MKPPIIVAAVISSVALALPADAAAKKHRKPVVHSQTAVSARPPAVDSYSVYVGGEYIGRDPDPNIRAYMRKSPHDWDGPE